MGLTIHWKLKAPGMSEDDVVYRMRAFQQWAAENLRLEYLSECEVFEVPPESVWRKTDNAWAIIQSSRYVKRDGVYSGCYPSRMILVATWPGEGCESANFSFGKYPASIKTSEGVRVRTGLKTKEWSGRGFCKTQYSQQFVACHLTVIAMLDKLKELGFSVDVSDEGDFWETRDLKKLMYNEEEYNQIVAAIGGALTDATDGKIVAPIMRNPAFEQLEMQGREKFGTPDALVAVVKKLLESEAKRG